MAIILIGMLLNEAATGSSIFFWAVIFFLILYSLKRYPKEEVFAMIGIAFGFICLFVLGGAYLILKSELELLATVWLIFWLAALIALRTPIAKNLTPTFYIADEFAKIVGPIPIHRELPKGCVLVLIETILFLILLMTAELLGPILWLIHLLLLFLFLKYIRKKGFSITKLLVFIVVNIVLIAIIWMIMENCGIDIWIRNVLGG